MTERIHRLTMRSFRGVPGEMEVDFGSGQSIAVYGDNGTGKSTIADALEWFFTGGIELLSHEGRQHAIRNLGGRRKRRDVGRGRDLRRRSEERSSFPTSEGRRPSAIAGRETFLLRGRTLADFINKTKTEKWKALAELLGLEAIELLRQDLQRVRTDIKKQAKAAEEKIAASRRAISSGDAAVTRGRRARHPPADLSRPRGGRAGVPRAGRGSLLDRRRRRGERRPGRSEAGDAVLDRLGPSRSPSWTRARSWPGTRIVSSEGGKDRLLLTLFRDADALLSSSPSPQSCPLCGQAVSARRAGLARARRPHRAPGVLPGDGAGP